MRHGSLFSGIGGFDLAAQWMGWENVFQVEIDPFCQKVLEKNFPGTKRYGDIKEFDGTKYRRAIDVLSGGFPCQPFSVAGKRKGKKDDRFLWPEMFRVIREVKPAFVVGENVIGIEQLGLVDMLSDLEDSGYISETLVLPACSVNGRHRRNRIWIIAHTKGVLVEKPKMGFTPWTILEPRESTQRLPGNIWRPDRETYLTEMAGDIHGVSNWVDRSKAIGNAIVPQVAFEIFKAIEMMCK